MGCENSKNTISMHLLLDSRYFQDNEFLCKASLNSPVQELFKEAKKRLINKENSFDLKMSVGGSLIDSSSDLCLKDLGICQNSKAKIGVRANNIKIRVLIQSENPIKAVISIQKKKKISDLKQKLIKNCDTKNFLILFRNVILPDDLCVKDLKIKDQEIITLIEKNNNKLLAIWRYKVPGLVIEGLCMNSDCQAYRQRVSISRGFGTFQISSELNNSLECIICGSVVSKIFCVGLAWCKFSVEYLDENQQKVCESNQVDHYQEIPEKWNSPQIEIFPLHSE